MVKIADALAKVRVPCNSILPVGKTNWQQKAGIVVAVVATIFMLFAIIVAARNSAILKGQIGASWAIIISVIAFIGGITLHHFGGKAQEKREPIIEEEPKSSVPAKITQIKAVEEQGDMATA